MFSPLGLLTDQLRIAAVEEPAVLEAAVTRLRAAWESVRHRGPDPDDGRELLLI